MAYELSCLVAYGIFLDQGSNLYPLYWQADSEPLDHQGSLVWRFSFYFFGDFQFESVRIIWTDYWGLELEFLARSR